MPYGFVTHRARVTQKDLRSGAPIEVERGRPGSSLPAPPSLRGEPWRTLGVGALIGLVAAGMAIGTAELVAGIVNPTASPIITVGQSAIDATPEWLKSLAIRTFGERDKTVLLGGIGATLLLAAVALGIASLRRLWVGVAGLLAFGTVGVASALTGPISQPHGRRPSSSLKRPASTRSMRRLAVPDLRSSSGEPMERPPSGHGWTAGRDHRNPAPAGAHMG
jgi:hypothetical protein